MKVNKTSRTVGLEQSTRPRLNPDQVDGAFGVAA